MGDILHPTVDFETEAIDNRPEYPPRPVGVAVRFPEGGSQYYGWGHPCENNSTKQEAYDVIEKLWDLDPIFHNGKFDLDVGEVHFDLPIPKWNGWHCTQLLAYLYNPHARQISLKPLAEDLLDWPPEERDRLKEWIEQNIPGINKKKNPWGAHIAEAPGDLVGEYAIGDVDRTHGLFNFFVPYIVENGMMDAYNRERKLMPILLEVEREGLRVNIEKLEQDYEIYQKAFNDADDAICKILGTEIEVGKPAQLVPAIQNAGLCSGEWPKTPTGKDSTSKENLESAVDHPEMLALLKYRGALRTTLSTFYSPWIGFATNGDGRLHTTWHQTRGDDGYGTRTGRVSSTKPNLTNVPNEYEFATPDWLPPLPFMREYLLPEIGHKWIKRDYDSQEVRILAHYENGSLMRQYLEDPNLDPHQWAADLIFELTAHRYDRKPIKRTAFSLLYGSGVKNLAAKLGVPYYEGKMIKDNYLGALPDVRELMLDVKNRGNAGLPVRTLGGRIIFAETSVDGRSFAYKLLNHLIQGSAGDATKEAMIYYDQAKNTGLLRAQVYDELNASVPEADAAAEHKIMRECMEAVKCDVTLKSSGYTGSNWLEADK